MASVNSNKQYKGNSNFGRISGSLGKFTHYNSAHNVANFQLSVQQNNGYYIYIPMVAWGDLAKSISQLKPRTKLHLDFHLHLSKNKVITKNGYQMSVPQVVAFRTYTPKSLASDNWGKIVGNFSKFSTYKLVGKNKNYPMLHFKVSSMDYNKNFNNYSFTAWGNMASSIHQTTNFKDFIRVVYLLSSYKLHLKNGHSLDIPQMKVTDCGPVENKKSSNNAPTGNKKSQDSTKDSTDIFSTKGKKLDIKDDDLPFK